MMWYDKHDEECVVWKTPIDESYDCTCKGIRRQNAMPPDYIKRNHLAWVEDVNFGLDNGLSTEEILESIGGIQWDSLMTRCTRNGYDNLARTLQTRRAQERERERSVRMAS